jgi:RNA polymerase sigma factor (sigma-70 family)
MVNSNSSCEDVARFETLYGANYKAIYTYVYRRVPLARTDVADIVSDTFIIAWRRIGDLPAAPQDRPWLFGVARLRLLEYHRINWHLARLSSRLEAEHLRADHPESATDLRCLRVQVALNELRQLDREVLTLIYWDGLSHAETASVLGCSINAVALRVKKAKVRLHNKLNLSSVDLTSNTSPLPIIRKEQLP